MKFFKPTVLLLTCLTILYSCSSESEGPLPEPEPDVIAPEIDFTIPGNSSSSSGSETPVISNQLVVDISAEDAGGIDKVEAFINNEKVGEDTTAPYQIVIDVSGYASKNSLTGKFTDYTLKITVTDTSGNETSQERLIHIDNELPTITEVSLSNEQVIGGDANSVTFLVSDNEGLNSVKTYLNDTLLDEHSDESYEININTLDLTDGENILRIEAIDLAENIINYGVTFIVDNTGPVINLNSIAANQILDEKITLSTSLTDEYSTVADIQILLSDIEVLTTSVEVAAGTEGIVEWHDLDPNHYPTGEQTFKLTATDALLNSTTLEVPVTILRKLFTLNIESGFLKNNWSSFWVLVSNSDGTPLTHQSLSTSDEELIFHAPGEFELTEKYMVTLVSVENMGTYQRSKLTNIQDLTRETFTEFNLTATEQEQRQTLTVNAEGFGVNQWEQMTGFGNGYYISHFTSPDDYFEINDNYLDSFEPEFYYAYSNDLEGASYGYYKFSNTTQNGSTIQRSEIETELDIVSSTLSIPSLDQAQANTVNLDIYGYSSETDVINNYFHQLFGNTLTIGFGDTYEYFLNSSFNNYSHNILINNYSAFRKSTPLDTYEIPNWTLDYVREGDTFTMNITGTEHTLGRIFLSSGNSDGYQMTVLFDSNREAPVSLPVFPEEMSQLDIYETSQTIGLEEQQLQLTSLSNISNYTDYLNTYVKDMKEHHMDADVIENILFQTGSYNKLYNFNFDE